MDSRGQLTMFVIIGLMLIAVVGVSIVFFTSDAETPEQTGRVDTQQVVSYLESCLREVSEEALRVAGRQGGYTDLSGRSFDEARPWLGEGYRDGPEQVPYWYHVDACEQPYGCVQFTPPPLCRDGECAYDSTYAGSETTIQDEVESYIDANVASCVEEHTLDSFTIEQEGAPESHVTFTENDVYVRLNMPIAVENLESGEDASLEEFATRLDVDFAELYKLARDLVQLQYQTTFAEENLLHFLSVYQGDPPNPPPFSGGDFLGGEKVWLRSEVEGQLEDEILPYLNFMQVLNAYEGYSPIINTGVEVEEEYEQYARGLFSYAELILPEGTYPDLGVSFRYPHSDIYLDINGDEVLRGDDLSSHNFLMKLVGVFIKRYEFDYDIAFPLLATVDDSSALGGEGYSFTFGIEGNVVNNLPMHSNRSITVVDARDNQPALDQASPEHHFEESEVVVQALDRRTGDPLEGAVVRYECGYSYTAGSTGVDGVWSGTLPYCAVGGELQVDGAFEYLSASEEFSNAQAGTHEFTMELWPYAEKEVRVYRRPIESFDAASCGPEQELRWGGSLERELRFVNGSTVGNESLCEDGNCTSESSSVPDDQYALVTMSYGEAVPSGNLLPIPNTFIFGEDGESVSFEPEFDSEALDTLLENGDLSQEEYDIIQEQSAQDVRLDSQLSSMQTVRLVPGEYSLDASLFYKGNLYIPSEKRSTGLFSSVTLPAQNLSTWVQGGASVESVQLSAEEVYGDGDIVIHMIEKPLPRTWSELEKDADYPVDELQSEFPGCARVFIREEG